MILKSSAMAVCMSFFLAGCGATYSKVEAGKTTLNKVASQKTFEFAKSTQTESMKLSSSDILSSVREEIKDKSPYSNCRSLCTKRSNSGGPTDVWGRKISHDSANQEIQLTLVNGEEYTNSYGTNLYSTNIKIPFQYELTEMSDKFVVVLFPPNEIETIPGSDPIFMNYKPLMEGENLSSRLVTLFDGLSPTLRSSVTREGEFNVDFDPASVKTNFTRLLSQSEVAESTSKTKYEQRFNLNLDGTTATVDVKIYLYRGKAKVNYRISYPYTIHSNGKTSEKDSSYMDNLEKRVREVANS